MWVLRPKNFYMRKCIREEYKIIFKLLDSLIFKINLLTPRLSFTILLLLDEITSSLIFISNNFLSPILTFSN
jgi:hypothetical protein